MKKYLTLILLLALANGMAYAAYAFTSWEVNPGNWPAGTRDAMGMLGFFFSGTAVCLWLYDQGKTKSN